MIGIRQQPGAVLLVHDSEVIVLAQIGIHYEDVGRAFQADLRAVRAIERVLPYRAFGATGYIKGQAWGD